MLNLCGQGRHDRLRFLAAHLGKHDIARAPFHQCRNEAVLRAGDQVTFPVAGNGTVFDAGRPLVDRAESLAVLRVLEAAELPAARDGFVAV